MKTQSIFTIITIFVTTAVLTFHVPATVASASRQPADAAVLRQQMQIIIDFLDSQEYADRVSWDEHVVLAYRLAGRGNPSTETFFLLKKLHQFMGLPRSSVLAFALRGTEYRPDWSRCREFLSRVRISDFSVNALIRQQAQKLAAEPVENVLQRLQPDAEALQMQNLESDTMAAAVAAVPNIQYNIYFGYLHSHSSLSDGRGDPDEAYAYARNQGGLDFFALSDHGELLDIWPWEEEWAELVAAAQNADDPGRFAALWGFEWSSPVYGHITVLNSNDFTDAISEDSSNDLFHWLVARPQAFGHFNHPGDYDAFGLEFQHLKLFPQVVSQMVGIENWNGNNSFDQYYYSGGWSAGDVGYWDEGNRKGWYLGSLGSQDNHERDWGTMNRFRTAVLARQLTRADIIDAYRQRRFYATEDENLVLDFRCQGYPMGARLSGVPRTFRVTAGDGDGDMFRHVRFYRNGALLETFPVTGNSFEIGFDDRQNHCNPGYYYVIVRQNDDNDGNGRNDEAISSPIWFDAILPGDFDRDGDVDGSDLATFAVEFGRMDCTGDCRGDFDNDGDVDGSDLAVFAAEFGRTGCTELK